jgi:hypothetical protein
MRRANRMKKLFFAAALWISQFLWRWWYREWMGHEFHAGSDRLLESDGRVGERRDAVLYRADTSATCEIVRKA